MSCVIKVEDPTMEYARSEDVVTLVGSGWTELQINCLYGMPGKHHNIYLIVITAVRDATDAACIVTARFQNRPNAKGFACETPLDQSESTFHRASLRFQARLLHRLIYDDKSSCECVSLSTRPDVG